MLTNEAALSVARKELANALYKVDTCNNPGLRKIAENKADWLVRLIQMSESYCKFHWHACSVLMPENSINNENKDKIICIVASMLKSGDFVIDLCTRRKSRFSKRWVWGRGVKGEIVWWADLPTLPTVE